MNTSRISFLCLILGIINIFIACDKEKLKGGISGDAIQVKVGVGDINLEYPIADFNSSGSNKGLKSSIRDYQGLKTQRIVVKDSAGFSYEAEIIPMGIEESGTNGSTVGKDGELEAAGPLIQEVPNGTFYRVAVYSMAGNYISHKDFKRGDPNSLLYGEDRYFVLDGNTDYIFMCYSQLSSGSAPELPDNPTAPLSQVKISPLAKVLGLNGYTEPPGNLDIGIDGGSDFMYWKSVVRVYHSMDLDIKLKHMFVGVDLAINAPVGGGLYISTVNPLTAVDSLNRIRPFCNRMTTNLSNGTFTDAYCLGVNLKGKTLFFDPQKNVTSLVFRPCVFYTGFDQTQAGIIDLHNITLRRVDGSVSKRDLELTGFTLNAGTRYKINVNILD
ncbi:hypothetical protein ACP6L2_15820 [Sphingobacterium lactis]|uniref:hypothetical protein n=1 Tax=Sphingobacterium lactis TaxID=797291 RepID=UPI003F7E5CA9